MEKFGPQYDGGISLVSLLSISIQYFKNFKKILNLIDFEGSLFIYTVWFVPHKRLKSLNILEVRIELVLCVVLGGRFGGTSNLDLKNTSVIIFSWFKFSKYVSTHKKICKHECILVFISELQQHLQLHATRLIFHAFTPFVTPSCRPRDFIYALAFACGMRHVKCFMRLHFNWNIFVFPCTNGIIAKLLQHTHNCTLILHVFTMLRIHISCAIVLLAVDELHFAHVHPLPFASHATASPFAGCVGSKSIAKQKIKKPENESLCAQFHFHSPIALRDSIGFVVVVTAAACGYRQLYGNYFHLLHCSGFACFALFLLLAQLLDPLVFWL